MNILAIVGLAILTAVLATLMRRYHKEYAMLLSVLGGGLILFMIFQNFTPALSSITDMLSASGVSGEYTIILIKTLDTFSQHFQNLRKYTVWLNRLDTVPVHTAYPHLVKL